MSIAQEIGSTATSAMTPFVQGGFGLTGQHYAHRYNKQLQERSWFMNNISSMIDRQWQEYMSNTAYQRSVADMRKAGLNPILMFGSASPASTPHGSTAGAVGSPSAISAGSISPLTFPDLIGFRSRRDAQKFARENHNVSLAQQEALLSSMELDAELKRAELQERGVNTALKALDLEYFSQPWRKDLRGWMDIKNATKNESALGKIAQDFSNVFERFRYNFQRGGSDSAPVVVKRPSSSNFTKYNYLTR